MWPSFLPRSPTCRALLEPNYSRMIFFFILFHVLWRGRLVGFDLWLVLSLFVGWNQWENLRKKKQNSLLLVGCYRMDGITTIRQFRVSFSRNHRSKLKPGVIHHRLGWFSSKECRQVRLIGTLEECFGGAVGCVLLSGTSDHTGCREDSIGNFRCCVCFLFLTYLFWLYAWLVGARVLH